MILTAFVIGLLQIILQTPCVYAEEFDYFTTSVCYGLVIHLSNRVGGYYLNVVREKQINMCVTEWQWIPKPQDL